MRRVIPNRELMPEIHQFVLSGHSVRLRVKGQSMTPFLIDDRDEVIITSFTPEQLLPGKIVLAFIPQQDRYVLHRIINRIGNQLELKGDGNIKGVEYCEISHVIGIVNQAIRNGRFVDFTAQRWFLMFKVWRTLTPLRRYLLWFIKSICYPGYFKERLYRIINLKI